MFKAQAKLNAVVLWIQSHLNTDQFGLMTNFPKKVFTVEDYKQSLDALNLVPSAVVIVTPFEKWDNLKKYEGTKNDDESRKVEEKRRQEEVEKQFKKTEEERLALERVRVQIEDDKAARRQKWPKYVFKQSHSIDCLIHCFLSGSLYQNSDQPSGNQLLQNQPQAILPLANRNQNRTHDKKFE